MNQKYKKELEPKFLSPEVIADFVSDRYKIKLSRPLEIMEGGIESVVWVATTEKEKWVVKVFGLREGPFEWVEEEASLYEYLNKHGISCPEIKYSIRKRPVEDLKVKSNIYPVMLMKFENLRECSPKTIKKKEFVKIAKDIARMHNVLRKYPNVERYKKEASLLLAEEKPKFLTIGSYPTLIKSPNTEAFNKAELKDIEALDKKMVEYVNTHIRPPGLIFSIIHGDLALEHIQFLPDGRPYFFDFADRCWGSVALEFGIMLVHLYRAEDISFKRWERLVHWLTGSYISVAKFNQKDRAAIKRFIICRVLDDAECLSEKAIDIQQNVDAKGIKRRYKLAEYVLRKWKN